MKKITDLINEDINNIKCINDILIDNKDVYNELFKIYEKYIYLSVNKEYMTELQIYRFIYRLNLYPKKMRKNKMIWKYYIQTYYDIRKNIISIFKMENQNKCALCNDESKIWCYCINIKYCSKKCHNLDWKNHKKDCNYKNTIY